MAGLGLLRYNTQLLKTIGLWPLDTSSRPLLMAYWLYTALLVISLAVVSVCQAIEIFVSPNITSMASAVDLATLTASALFKMIYIILYRDYFQRLVDKIDSTFVQNDFFTGKFDIYDTMKNAKKYILFYISMGGPMLFVTFGLQPVLEPIISLIQNSPIVTFLEPTMMLNGSMYDVSASKQSSLIGSEQTNLTGQIEDTFVSGRKLPFNCWFPFDVTWSPLYEVVYILELVPLFASGHLYLVSDSFFFMMIYLTCGQLELLKVSFRGLNEKFEELKQRENFKDNEVEYLNTQPMGSPTWNIQWKYRRLENEMNEAVIKCVDLHCEIIQIIRDLDSLLRSMVLVDFSHAVISLSFAMLQTITSNTLFAWSQMCIFIAVCILHQFLNNYFGEILSQQMSVAEAVYETPWVDGTEMHKMAVYMTLNQANHPTKLSGWRMYHLGLGTFVEFMKLLTSYFLVLQSLHADESRKGR